MNRLIFDSPPEEWVQPKTPPRVERHETAVRPAFWFGASLVLIGIAIGALAMGVAWAVAQGVG